MEYHENLTPAEMGRGIPEDAPDIAGRDLEQEAADYDEQIQLNEAVDADEAEEDAAAGREQTAATHHSRRTQRRMDDPKFRAEYERAAREIAQVDEAAEAAASDDGMPEAPPWVTEGREPTVDEKIDVLAGTVEYLDGQLAEVREACSQMARVLVRLVRAVDDADPNRPARVYGPDGTPLNRKQRRDIAFGRAGE